MVLRKYYFLFGAFGCIVINNLWIENNKLNWLLLSLFIIRLLMSRCLKLVITCLCISGCWFLLQNKINGEFIKGKVQNEFENAIVILYSDQIKYDDKIAKFSGTDINSGNQVQICYCPKKINELNHLKRFKGKIMINAYGKQVQPDLPTNENQFNYRKQLLSQNIKYCMFSDKIQIQEVAVENGKEYLIDQLHQLRQLITNKLLDLKQPLRGYAQALILGNIVDEFEDTYLHIKIMGILYLVCLSGMHVLFLKRYIQYCLQLFGISQEYIDVFLIIVLPCYCIIGGNNLSLSRAIWMAWLGLLSQYLLKNKLTGIECWCIVTMFFLLIYPAMFYSLGAKLSYLMTFVLLASDQRSSMLLNLKLNLLSLPLILNSSYQFNGLTIIFSIIIGYLFENLIFPITILGCVFPFFQNIACYILNFFDRLFDQLGSLKTIVTFGKMPIMVCIIVILLMLSLENKRNLKIKITMIGGIFLITYCWIHYPLNNEVVYFDIGQGDSTLVREKYNRQVFLIDTGGKLNFGNRKEKKNDSTQGQRIIANYLLSKGISRIDGLYLTHQDTDHVGYFPSISKDIKINKIYVPAGMENLKSFNERLAKMNYLPEIMPIMAGMKNKNGLKILHPFCPGKGTNQDSLVLFYEVEQKKFIFTGDLDRSGELKVIGAYPELKVNVLKLGHHGSKTSSAKEFISCLAPDLAIISAGRHNRYYHPNQETLITLNQNEIPYLLTARDGMIKISINNGHLKIKRYMEDQ